MSDHSREIDQVARLIRDRIDGEATVTDNARGPARVRERLGATPTSLRRVFLSLAPVFAALTLIVFVRVSSTRLSYVVDSPGVAASGPTNAIAESLVTFSDGSRLRLAAGAAGHVEQTAWRGAVFLLENGTLEADIVHRSFSSWSVHAGPFTIAVKGTRFGVSWSSAEQRFVLTLHDGEVEVRGALLKDDRKVHTGQRLVVDLTTQRSWVEPASENSTATGPPSSSVEPSVSGSGGNDLGGGAAKPEGSAASEPSSAVELQSVEGRAAPTRTRAPTWAERVGAGDFRGVVEDARARGSDTVLLRATSADLSALADAARYLGDRALSTKALTIQRQRFPGTERAAMGAFLMGKLAEEGGDVRSALSWYDRYLDEQPNGTFAQEALGRKMLILRLDDPRAAQVAAGEYLRRFPKGPRSTAAEQIAGHP